MSRIDPLGYLSTELESLKAQGLYRHLRILRTSAEAAHDLRRPLRRQPLVEQLSRPDDAPEAAGARACRRWNDMASALVRSARSRAPWPFTWSSSSGWRSSSRPKPPSSSRADSPRTPAQSRRCSTKDDIVISDELNHASIIDGCRLSRATIKVFPHKDVDARAHVLARLPAAQRKLLITDGVFSMDGDLGPLPGLCALAEEYGCIMMVDDAHASGVFGQERPRHRRSLRDVTAGSTSRSARFRRRSARWAAMSPAAAPSSSSCYHRARPFLFSTSHPPSVAAACLAALDVLQEEPEIIDRLWENTRFFKDGLKRLGFNTGPSESPITPVIVGEARSR